MQEGSYESWGIQGSPPLAGNHKDSVSHPASASKLVSRAVVRLLASCFCLEGSSPYQGSVWAPCYQVLYSIGDPKRDPKRESYP